MHTKSWMKKMLILINMKGKKKGRKGGRKEKERVEGKQGQKGIYSSL